MKRAILIVSFGTTHLETLEKNIAAVEKAVQEAYPQVPCFRAFTSVNVRRKLKNDFDLVVDSVGDALQRIESQGFTHVSIQPTLLLPGEEFEQMRRDVLNAAGGLTASIGLPLLWDDRDFELVARALKEAYPLPEDTALLAMGHGTSHCADGIYFRLRRVMNAMDMELCTVEGGLDFLTAEEALLRRGVKKVHLVPLLLVAGDHSVNDMAGDGPGSLKSLLRGAGFEVTCSLKGLGELPKIREAICARIPG